MAASLEHLPRLIVQGDPDLAASMTEALTAGHPTHVEHVSTLADALTVSHHHLAVVILDLDLADSAGTETFYTFSAERPEHPILVISDHPREPVGHELIRAGATEVIGRDCIDDGVLLAAVEVAITRWERRRRLTDLNVDAGVLMARISSAQPLLDEAQKRLTDLETRLRSSSDSTLRGLTATVADVRARFGAVDQGESPIVEWLASLRAMAGTHGPRVTIECGIAELPPDVGRHVRAATQEMLANALKHAKATTITIEIRMCGAEIDVRVSDDGAGLGDHLIPGDGLLNLERRAQSLGGGFRHRRSNGCTHLDWWVPVATP